MCCRCSGLVQRKRFPDLDKPAVGGFTPRGPTHDGGGLLDPKDAFKSLFLRGKVPMRGSIGVSVEEGLVRSIAADAAL